LTLPLVKDVKRQVPEAGCDLSPGNVSRNLIINRDVPPFNDPELRRAMGLSLDRQAFIDILTEGLGKSGGVMLPPPEGVWGMPPGVLQSLPGYGPHASENPADAPQIQQKLGYGPHHRPAGQAAA